MTKKALRPERARGKAEAESEGAPMERFKALARRLAKVPRQELEEEQRQYEAEKAKRRRKS